MRVAAACGKLARARVSLVEAVLAAQPDGIPRRSAPNSRTDATASVFAPGRLHICHGWSRAPEPRQQSRAGRGTGRKRSGKRGRVGCGASARPRAGGARRRRRAVCAARVPSGTAFAAPRPLPRWVLAIPHEQQAWPGPAGPQIRPERLQGAPRSFETVVARPIRSLFRDETYYRFSPR